MAGVLARLLDVGISALGRSTRLTTRGHSQLDVKLLQAVGEVARETPDELTMQAIAARAEISPATAYRYYSTIEEVLAAYSFGVVEELIRYSEECALKGRALFEAVLGKWLELLEDHGAALTQLRSRRGYLERLHAGDDTILATERAWRRPVTGLLDELGLPTDQLEYACS